MFAKLAEKTGNENASVWEFQKTYGINDTDILMMNGAQSACNRLLNYESPGVLLVSKPLARTVPLSLHFLGAVIHRKNAAGHLQTLTDPKRVISLTDVFRRLQGDPDPTLDEGVWTIRSWHGDHKPMRPQGELYATTGYFATGHVISNVFTEEQRNGIFRASSYIAAVA